MSASLAHSACSLARSLALCVCVCVCEILLLVSQKNPNTPRMLEVLQYALGARLEGSGTCSNTADVTSRCEMPNSELAIVVVNSHTGP